MLIHHHQQNNHLDAGQATSARHGRRGRDFHIGAGITPTNSHGRPRALSGGVFFAVIIAFALRIIMTFLIKVKQWDHTDNEIIAAAKKIAYLMAHLR